MFGRVFIGSGQRSWRVLTLGALLFPFTAFAGLLAGTAVGADAQAYIPTVFTFQRMITFLIYGNPR